ncbi:MAG: peptidylprolyl isomerase [Erysipelotrichaceae bacterium]|nr:peptidylprolyl isomerase [Erysipelotrichaceae bacterium]
MNELIKKYWFVTLVGVLFFIAIGVFAFNDLKEEFKGKTIDGKDVMFEYNGIAVTADDLYDEMFDDYAAEVAIDFIQAATIRNAFTPDKDMLSEAKLIYENYVSYYKASYGETYADYLLPSLKAMGFSKVEDLEEYILISLMLEELNKQYIDTNMDTLFPAFTEAKSPRIISHILVMMDDVSNPTAEEEARMSEVDAAFANGDSFAAIAERFSDDSSASAGGRFGYADLSTSLDTEFAAAAFSLAEGEVSGWIRSQYGYHIIKIDSVSLDVLKAEDGFYSALTSYYNLSPMIIWQEYQKRSIDFHGNDALQEKIENMLRVEAQEVSE